MFLFRAVEVLENPNSKFEISNHWKFCSSLLCRLFDSPPRGGKFLFETFHIGEREPVFAGHDLVRQRVERVAGQRGVGG